VLRTAGIEIEDVRAGFKAIDVVVKGIPLNGMVRAIPAEACQSTP
jgi:hypothetical protein